MESLAIILPLVAGAAGGVGQLYQGSYEKGAANFEADQLEKRGEDEIAIAGANASKAAREAKLTNSRNLAVAAASGAGTADPGVIDIMADTEAQGVYNSLNEMYKGELARTDLLNEAKMRRKGGSFASTAGKIGAVGTIFSGAGNAAGNYIRMK